MKAIDALKISQVAIRKSDGAIVLTTPSREDVTRVLDGQEHHMPVGVLGGGDWEPLVEHQQSLDDALAANIRLTTEKAELTAELEYVGKVVERFKDGSEFVGEQAAWEDIPFGTFFWIQFPGHKERLLRCESSRDQKMEATYWEYTGPTTAPIPEEPDYAVQVDEPVTPECHDWCKPGTPVWYSPSPGLKFPANVAGDVRYLGGTPVVRLSGLPVDYMTFTGRLHTTVAAAALDRVLLREEGEVMPEPPVDPDVLDKQDGQKDFYDRYYVQGYYCGNCDAGNTRYVRKGVKVTSVPVTCEKCGCEIQEAKGANDD